MADGMVDVECGVAPAETALEGDGEAAPVGAGEEEAAEEVGGGKAPPGPACLAKSNCCWWCCWCTSRVSAPRRGDERE